MVGAQTDFWTFSF